jgi:2-polyprenyl-6-methoxyphenol hydroxylase-like FAD-dependent oxidoreductase
MTESPRVLVAGAGIGGLAVAIGLHRIGAEVRIVERRARPAVVGAGIALFPNAIRAFDVLGVGDAVRAVAAHPVTTDEGGGVRLPSGRWLLHTRDEQDTGLLACHRNDLHTTLLAALPPRAVEAGTELAGARSHPDGIEVVLRTAAGEQQARADLLIAADGVDSAVRRALWPDTAAPRYAGYTAWRGITSTGSWRVPSGETWGRGVRFGIVPIGGRRVYWFATDNRPAGSGAGLTAAQRHAEVSRMFGGWHDPIPALLAATDPDDVLHHDIGLLDPPVASFVAGRAVLLGDAAHAMTPDLGQGACQAVEDAVVLTAELAAQLRGTSPDLADALRRYDAARRPRTQRVARTARRLGRIAQLDAKLPVALRTAALWALPPAVLRSGQGWLTDWQPPAIAG